MSDLCDSTRREQTRRTAASDWLLGPETQLASDHCGVSAENLDISSSVSYHHAAASSVVVVSRQCVPGRRDKKGGPMYIGLGTLVLIVVVLLIIYLVRRA